MARGYSQSKSELNTNWGRERQLLKQDLPRNPIMRTTVEQERDYWPMVRKYKADEANAIDKEMKPLIAAVKKMPKEEKERVIDIASKLQFLIGEHVKRNMNELEDAQRGNREEIQRADSLKQKIVERVGQLPENIRNLMFVPEGKMDELSRGADRPTLTTALSGNNIASFTDDPYQSANFGKGTGIFGIQRFYTAKDIDSFDKIIDLQRVGRFAFGFSKKNEDSDFIKETIRDEREYLVTGIKWKESTLKEKIGTEYDSATI